MKSKITLKEYLVTVDVSFSRNVAVIASSEENAAALAKERVAFTSGCPVDEMEIYYIKES